MGALPYPAGIRIRNELLIEIRIEYSVDSMVEEPVPHRSLVNVPRLRVRDIEGMVAAVSVVLGFQVLMEGENVVHQAQLELLDVFPSALASQEFLPGL